MALRRYNYRIYPNTDQIQLMKNVGGSVRFVFNYFLKINIEQYANNKKFVWYNDTAKLLTALKTQLTWLNDTYSQVLQQSLRDLDTALKNIKKTGAGFPRFKNKYTTPIRFRYQQHTGVVDNKLHLPKIGAIPIQLHRALPSNYTGVTIIQRAGRWYASFVVDVPEYSSVINIHNSIGIDVNSKYTALSTGELVSNPQPLSKNYKHIKCQQRKLSRKAKRSRNKQKAKLKLARIHDRVRCQRHNHIHQTSTRIAKEYDLVLAETLKIDEMRRKSKLAAKAIADAGWAQLLSALEYKCQQRGHYFIRINQWLPSSKTCSACGHKKYHIDISERTYICDICDHTAHRDINAAINIRNWGQQQWTIDHSRQELPGAPVDLLADIIAHYGDESASTRKQEAAISLE